MVIDNIRGTTWFALMLTGLVWVALRPTARAGALELWCLAQVALAVNIERMVRKHDRWAPMTGAQTRRLNVELFVSSGLGSINWGCLLWTVRPDASPIQFAVVYALIAAVQCGAVSTLAPIPALALGFLLTSAITVLLGVGLPALVAHPALVFGGALYLATLADHTARGARAARTSIDLSFENGDLLERVREEHGAAELARRSAEEASAAKSHVLAAASHDLRQPVHAQGLFLELLRSTRLDVQQRELLDRVSEAVGASTAMLGTLFDYSRIEAGVVRPQYEAFALQPLLNKIEREFGPQADARQLLFRARESALVVQSDPALVELILRNLVSNAIRYTRRGGLLVACRRRGDRQAVLEVWDTGIGIAPEHQAEIFREFRQLDNPERDRHKGFGLGLSIVDGLARALGHTVTLRSIPGRGSVFRLHMPLADPHPAPAPRGVPEGPRRLQAHVLVVEDDADIRMGMAKLLQSWGCSCDLASSEEHGMQLALRRRPDLLITDHRLGTGSDGLNLIRRLQQQPPQKPLSTILVTGDVNPNLLREAASAGVALLHKPVHPASLYHAMAEAVGAEKEGADPQRNGSCTQGDASRTRTEAS